jgi:hypothetical protein
MVRFLPVFLLVACTGGEADTDTPIVDHIVDPADHPAPEGGEQWLGPDVVVEPYSEVQYCMFGTYTGEDVGMTSFDSYQGEGGHHLILLGTSAGTDRFADGEVIDCTATGDLPMTDFEPLINAEPIAAGRSSIVLPGTYAVKLRQGQRYVVQAHYVNTTPERLRFQDVMTIGMVPEDTVTTWAAAFALTVIDFTVPPGESSVDFGCDFEESYNILYLTGHLHEYGKSFRLDHTVGDATTELYEIPSWNVSYRDAPPLQKYGPGDLTIDAGTTLTTTCAWNNDTTADIEFPHEMCATYGMLYPSLVPVVCQPW